MSQFAPILESCVTETQTAKGADPRISLFDRRIRVSGEVGSDPAARSGRPCVTETQGDGRTDEGWQP